MLIDYFVAFLISEENVSRHSLLDRQVPLSIEVDVSFLVLLALDLSGKLLRDLLALIVDFVSEILVSGLLIHGLGSHDVAFVELRWLEFEIDMASSVVGHVLRLKTEAKAPILGGLGVLFVSDGGVQAFPFCPHS